MIGSAGSAAWSPRIDEARAADYRAKRQWGNPTVSVEARARAAETPEALCAIDGDRAITFAAMLADAESLAAGLRALGLQAGDVVSFQLPNWHETMVIDLAADLLGCIVNPIVPIYRGAEMEFILADSCASVAFVPETYRGFRHAEMVGEMKPRLPGLKQVIAVRGSGDRSYDALLSAGRGRKVPTPRTPSSAIKLVMYTSGTTGRAKGVLHSHDTLGWAARYCRQAWGIAPGTRVLAVSPVTHIASFLHGLEMPYFLGSCSVMLPQWNAAEAVRLIENNDVEFIGGATPFLQDLVQSVLDSGRGLPSLRAFSCGGAAVPPALIRRAHEVMPGLRASRSYGATEGPWITRGFHADGEGEVAADSDGKILDWEIRIADDRGQSLPDGTEGEVLARGPALFLGYTDPANNAEAFDADGFFRTGDLGVKRGDALTITGRKKDLIIRGGENLSAKEIEDVLHRHPAVREAAVVSMPHPRLGETVCAYVIANAGSPLDLPSIVAHCAASGLAKQKSPERLELVYELPRTASGKVRKDLLRREIAARLAPGRT